jgi:hypothetical protein
VKEHVTSKTLALLRFHWSGRKCFTQAFPVAQFDRHLP